jgi:hypothetical protein
MRTIFRIGARGVGSNAPYASRWHRSICYRLAVLRRPCAPRWCDRQCCGGCSGQVKTVRAPMRINPEMLARI